MTIFSVEFFLKALFLGGLATLFMDLWAFLLKIAFGVQGLDYRYLGRWVAYFPKKVFLHKSIFNANPVSGELLLGYFLHYMIGVFFAACLLLIYGQEWVANPSILPALILGIATVFAPFFIMQPAFGMGIAGSLTPNPSIVRLKSLMAHISYGFGLYFAGLILAI